MNSGCPVLLVVCSRLPVLLALPSIWVAWSRRPFASTLVWPTVETSRGPCAAGLNRAFWSACGWFHTLDCWAAVLPWALSSWTVMGGACWWIRDRMCTPGYGSVQAGVYPRYGDAATQHPAA